MTEINPEHYFILCTGHQIKSLEELISILKNIDKKTFEYHVNDSKNDFENWIRYVFKLRMLADTISSYRYEDRSKMVKAIKTHLESEKILVLNAGSSSLKFQLIDLKTKDVLIKGMIDAINLERCSQVLYLNGEKQEKQVCIKSHEEAITTLIEELFENDIIGHVSEIKAVGHRVVHGGEVYTKTVKIDEEVLGKLRELCAIAPLHNPANIACIEAAQRLIPAPHVAVFDTAFHHTIPKEKYTYAIPYEYYEKHKIRKYGFHGTSHKYLAKLMMDYYKIKKKKDVKMIICHLGNGCSITAVYDGKSINNSMGFTPIDGLMMGTRSGSVDPGVICHIEKIEHCSCDDTTKILNKRSGLLGISGHPDMRDIHANQKDPRCRLAMDMFADRVIHFIGAYTAELGGVDAIVFSGGLGENAFYIRRKVLENFKYLGLKLDEKANEKNDFIITSKDSKVEAFVVPTNEELQIALETKQLLKI